MKWDCGPTWRERFDAKHQWHRWFAWRPVRVGSHDCRWLEWIERKGDFNVSMGGAWWDWEYRAEGSAEGSGQ